MSSTEEDSETSYDSEGSGDSSIDKIEVEYDASDISLNEQPYSSDDEAGPFAEDPIADAEWTAQYEEEMLEEEELEKRLKERLDGSVGSDQWCKCGNCSVALLQNISECYCCRELEGCCESLSSDMVQQDLAQDVVLKCVTEHPGFNPVCLQKWSLRLAASKYKTKGKQHYKQKGSEESYLRSISYREFSRLIHGYLGHRRIPLPACAYHMIRKEFPVNKSETFTGFDLDED